MNSVTPTKTHRELVAITSGPRPVSRGASPGHGALATTSTTTSPSRLHMYEDAPEEVVNATSPMSGKAPTVPKYTLDHIGIDQPTPEMLREMFDYFDADATGSINKEEFKAVYAQSFENYGAPMSDRDLERTFASLDRDGSGQLNFDEFCVLMMKRLKM